MSPHLSSAKASQSLSPGRARRRQQRGMSLVGLMVGLALSTTSVVATLYGYKSIVVNSLSSAANSRAQNVNASVALQLSRIAPQAGWGLGAAATPPGAAVNTDFVLVTGASLAGGTLSGSVTAITAVAQSGNAVVWDSAASGTTQCSALLATSDGGVSLLGPVACANATGWNTLSWLTPVPLLAPASLLNASFAALKTSCWPYSAIAGGQGAVQVTLSGSSSAATSVCLANLVN